jgi:cation diffusion facilitator family transporter
MKHCYDKSLPRPGKLDTHSAQIVATVRRVTWIGFWVNAALMTLKLTAGWLGHSDALVADGFHSLSDFVTDVIVIVFIGIAYRSADSEHPYGHGKYETMATLLVAVALLIVGIALGYEGGKSVVSAINGTILPKPRMVTLYVAAISILSKEWLFRYTIKRADSVNSSSLRANAWHHRSDALSSVATLVGVAASIFLSESWRILDPIASVVISVFIAWSAIDIARGALNELLERSLSHDDITAISAIIVSTPGVIKFHHLRTRRVGHSAIIDLHIKVDPNITVTAGHDIATHLEHRLRTDFDSDLITNIHVEPAK